VSAPQEKQWVTIAQLGRAWGNQGSLTARELSSRPDRYQQLREVYLFSASLDGACFEIEAVSRQKNQLIFKFRGVDSISQAEELERAEVRIPLEERLTPDEGEYFQSDLIGCEIREKSSGERLGVVTGWQETGGPGVLKVERDGNGGELLIPFARSICGEIDIDARRIVVDLPEGLKDLNQP